MSTTRERRKRRRNRFRRNETVDVSLSFTRLTAESDKATTNFVNLHGPTTNRTFGVGEREEFRGIPLFRIQQYYRTVFTKLVNSIKNFKEGYL